MTVARIDINLSREKPMEISYARVERESRKYLYLARPGKKAQPLARTALHRPILSSPVSGVYFILSETEDRIAIESSEAMQLGGILLLDEMEARMQLCAIRLNEIMDELYSLRDVSRE